MKAKETPPRLMHEGYPVPRQIIFHAFSKDNKIRYILGTLAFCVLLLLISETDFHRSTTLQVASANGSYRGKPWHSERTISIETLGETKFARCDVHTVRNEDGSGSINDWIFMEEMNAVNVAVMTAEGKFAVFKQRKYAIPGDTLSPVGGFINDNEAPFESARREVMEELGLGSRATLEQLNKVSTSSQQRQPQPVATKEMFAALPKRKNTLDEFELPHGTVSDDESSDWIFLGKYRTAANRGGGFIYTYLLKNAIPILPSGGTSMFKPSGDDESQDIHFLSQEDVRRHVMDGDFQEVKWAATLSLSLLHLDK